MISSLSTLSSSLLKHSGISILPPNAPSNLVIVASSDAVIRVQWTASTGSPSSYTINITSPSSSSITGISTSAYSGYNITGLTSSTTYTFNIQGVNSGGSSTSSSSIQAMTLHTYAYINLSGTYTDNGGLVSSSSNVGQGTNLINRTLGVSLSSCYTNFGYLSSNASAFRSLMSGKTIYLATKITSTSSGYSMFTANETGMTPAVQTMEIDPNQYWLYTNGASGGSPYDSTNFKYIDSTNGGNAPSFSNNTIYHLFYACDTGGYAYYYVFNNGGTQIIPAGSQSVNTKLVNMFYQPYVTSFGFGNTNGGSGTLPQTILYFNIFNSQLSTTQMKSIASTFATNGNPYI